MDDNTINQNMGQKRNAPRDVFLHLFVMVALYWSSVSFITLLWQYINYFFPDNLSLDSYYPSSLWVLRFAVSSLIIFFPLFILVSRYLNKIYEKEGEVKESKIRKWMIYLTLFIASLVIIGDLISIINTFLGGEIQTRFILKALSVLVVAGVIFGYYLNDVKRVEPSKSAKYFGWGSSLIVLISIVGVFFIIGSPMSARSIQFDQQKVSDLQNIQWQVVNHWQRKERLPQNLDELQDPISGYSLPNDPQEKEPYEYGIKDGANLIFELCATFNLESKENPKVRPLPLYYSSYDTLQNWAHGKGRICFERKIDKELYPPFSQTGEESLKGGVRE